MGDGARYGVFVTVMSRVSMCMPGGTRQASTHTVHVCRAVRRGAIGTGSGRVDAIVAQSWPAASRMCVPRTTVPWVAGTLPLVLVNANVTSSHQGCSRGVRCGSPMAIAGSGDVDGEGDGFGVGAGDGGGEGLAEGLAEGEGDLEGPEGVGLGEGDGSSGTNSTAPVGGTAWDTSGPAAPVAT